MQLTLVQARPHYRRAAAALPFARGDLAVLGGLVALAAVLRFSTLSEQSFWHDEAVTVGRVLKPSLGATINADASSEATPPAYYVLAWLWTRVFGTSEAGVRALSAVCGVALVPTMYAAARHLLWPRAATMAAALVAVSPFLVWYSQEARAYSLLALLAGLSLLCMARALELPSGGRVAAWATVAALALATHYFAVFLVAPEAAWLLLARVPGPRRPRVLGVAAVAVAGAALLPLAIHQAHVHPDTWIGRIPPAVRVANTGKAFVVGPSGSPSALVYLAGAAALLAALALLVTRSEGGERRLTALPLALGAGALIAPLALMAVGVDYFYPRNVTPALVVLLLVPAAGLGVARAGRAGMAAAVLLCTVNAAAVLAVTESDRLQRSDWRAAAAAIGPAQARRALVVPFIGDDPLAYYLPGTGRARGSTTVSEVDVLGWGEGRPAPVHPPAPGFREVGRRRFEEFTLVRFRGPPHAFGRAALARARIGSEHAAVLVQQPPS
jgi:uncharacterized membrane protein